MRPVSLAWPGVTAAASARTRMKPNRPKATATYSPIPERPRSARYARANEPRKPAADLFKLSRYVGGMGNDMPKLEHCGDQAVPALHLDNVVKTYGLVRAVDGVSLTVRPGEFIALLGPNGAGKSTLFQLLSGLFVADSGRIEVMGHDMARDAVPALAQLGIVFQQPTLDLELSVTANLLFHAGLQGIPRATAKAPIAQELH